MIALVLSLALAAPPVTVESLQDGTQLVYARVPGPRVALRVVVRSGGARDPVGKAGLAHILEHLVFHGTYTAPEGEMFARAWGAGAYLNAFTSAQMTQFVLDTPATSFMALAPDFVSMVTAPALPFASFDREKGVVGAEASERPDAMSIEYALDQLVFPAANGAQTVIGTDKTREDITIEDIQEFYAQNYVPKNMVIVVVGDVAVDDVRRALEAGLRGPPGVDGPAQPEAETPNLPVEAKELSFVTVSADMRLVDGASRGACEAAAALLELRLREKILGLETVAADTHTICHRSRGHDFLVQYVMTTSPDSSSVPDWMAAVVADAARRPASASERAEIEQRRRAALSLTNARPDSFASALVLALGDGTVEAAVKEMTSPPALSWTTVPKVLALASNPKNIAALHFSRFEQK